MDPNPTPSAGATAALIADGQRLRDAINPPRMRRLRALARRERIRRARAAWRSTHTTARCSSRPRARRSKRTASSSRPTSGASDGDPEPAPIAHPPASSGAIVVDRLPIPPRPDRGGRRGSGLSRDALLTRSPSVTPSSTHHCVRVTLIAAEQRQGTGAPSICAEEGRPS